MTTDATRSASAARRSRSVRTVRSDRALGEARRRHPSSQVIDLREGPGRTQESPNGAVTWTYHPDSGRDVVIDVEALPFAG